MSHGVGRPCLITLVWAVVVCLAGRLLRNMSTKKTRSGRTEPTRTETDERRIAEATATLIEYKSELPAALVDAQM